MSEDLQVIEHAVTRRQNGDDAPFHASPPTNGADSFAVLTSNVQRLLLAVDDNEIDLLLGSSPRFQDPDLVALLAEQSRRLISRGDPVSGDRFHRLATRITGTGHPGTPDAVAAVVRLARTLARAGPDTAGNGGSALDEQAQAAASAVQHLLAVDSAGLLDPAFAPRLWELLSATAARAAMHLGPQPWLETAVATLRRSIALCPAHDPRLLALLNDLSVRLSQLYRTLPDRSLLTEAVATARRVVELTPAGDRQQATRLMNLSNRLHDLFDATGDDASLDAAVATARRAVATAPDDLDTLPLLIENLSQLLDLGRDASFQPPSIPLSFSPEQTSRIDQVATAQRALASVDIYDRTARAAALEELADRLALLFQATGDIKVLEEAVERAREAVELTDRDHPRWTNRAAKLSSRLTEQHRTTGEGESEVLSEAVDLCIEVVRRTPADAHNSTKRLENLCERVAESALLDRRSARLAAAVEAARHLLSQTPTDSPERKRRVALLATMLVEHHRRTGSDAGKASADSAKALLASIADDPDAVHDFVDRCRRQLRASESSLRSLNETFDMAETERVAGIDRWLDALTDHARKADHRTAPVPGADAALGPAARRGADARPAGPPPGLVPGDTTARLIQVELWLMFLIPAGLRIGVLGGVGTPSLVWALCLFPIWAITSAIPPYNAGRPCHPVRWMLGVFWTVNLFSYALLHRHTVAGDEGANADRYFISLVAFSGVALMTAEGIRTREQQLRVVRTATAGAAAMCFVALLQFKFALDLTIYLSRIPGLTTGRALNGVFDRDGFNRPAGTATHPIEFAVITAATLALSIHVLLYDHKWPQKRRWMLLGLIALGIPIAVSRSALLVSVPVLLVFFIDADPKRKLKALGVLSALLAVVFVFVPGLIGTLKGFVLAGNSDSSIATRTGDYAAISPYVRANPWFGRGPGTFLPRLRILDNQYLLSLVETGITGLFAAIGLYSLPSWLGSASRSKMTDPGDRQLARMLLAIGLGIIAGAATFDATSFPMFQLYVAFLIGLAGSHWNRAVAEDQENAGPC